MPSTMYMSGSFSIPVSGESNRLADKAIKSLYGQFLTEELGNIALDDRTISYDRKYELLPAQGCKMGMFNPGKITLIPDQKSIKVYYRWGLKTLNLPIIMGLIIIMYLSYYGLKIAIYAAIMMVILMTAGVIFDLVMTRRWVKSVISDAVNSRKDPL